MKCAPICLSFTKLKWHEKYKIVFSLSIPEFKEFYDYFHELSKFRRNPTAHGFVDPLFTEYKKITLLSDEELDQYICAHSAMTDAYANMDW